jgi:hypothetical protein
MPKKNKIVAEQVAQAPATPAQKVLPSISLTFGSATDVLRAFNIAEYFAKKNSLTTEENDYLIELLKFTNDVTKSINQYFQSLEQPAPVETQEQPVLDQPVIEVVDGE